MSQGWLDALTRHAEAGTPSVLLTIARIRGSAPREAGAKMVVSALEQDGTIGGGALEHECGRIARDLLRHGSPQPLMRDFPLGPALGQCCGGHVTVLFEPMLPPGWQVVIFGAGHVGRALVAVLSALPCRMAWIDDRPGVFAAAVVPGNVVCVSQAARDFVVPAAAMVLVMTHDHQLDYEIVRKCLARDDLAFVGLIGSATKRARFAGRLARDGILPASLARLTCPIGVAGAGGKLPAEIAVAVAAQMLMIRDTPTIKAGRMAPEELAAREAAGCGDLACAGCAAT